MQYSNRIIWLIHASIDIRNTYPSYRNLPKQMSQALDKIAVKSRIQ